jgi:anti-sigma factor RsiW
MKSCEEVQPLVAVYLDGELSDTQAAPVRQHLLDCPACRQKVQEAKALKSWFRPTEEVPVPRDFAAHVARRAFAGDRGLLVPTAPPSEAVERDLGRFVMNLTALAAAALLLISLSVQLAKRPDGETLRAENTTLEESLQDLDRLNQQEFEGVRDQDDRSPRDAEAEGQ